MFQNGPRGPAPSRPAPRPSYTPPPSVPIRTLVNPVTPYRPPARSGGIAHAIGGAVREVSHALAPVARSAANTTRSPASATTQQLALRIAKTQQYDRATNQKVNSLAQSIWSRAIGAGYSGPNAKMPPLAFNLPDLSHFETHIPNAGTRAGRSVEAPHATGAAFSQNVADYRNFTPAALLHEFAHSQQTKGALINGKALAEGGAQAYTDLVGPKIGVRPVGDGNYSSYVQQVLAREPRQWIEKGQFQPGAQAPAVNMPGTRSFRVAMRGIGRVAGSAAATATPEMVWDSTLGGVVPLAKWLAARKRKH